MKRYEFKANTDSEAIIRETFEDGSSLDLFIEIRECTVVVSLMHESDYWSSPVIVFSEIGKWAGETIYMTVLAGLGNMGVRFNPAIHGCKITEDIQDWCRANAERRN